MNKPKQLPDETASPKQKLVASGILGSIFLGVILYSLFKDQAASPETRQEILGVVVSLFAAIVSYFIPGAVGLDIKALRIRGSEFSIAATTGFAIFLIVLASWQLIPHHFFNLSTNEIKKIRKNTEDIKARQVQTATLTREIVYRQADTYKKVSEGQAETNERLNTLTQNVKDLTGTVKDLEEQLRIYHTVPPSSGARPLPSRTARNLARHIPANAGPYPRALKAIAEGQYTAANFFLEQSENDPSVSTFQVEEAKAESSYYAGQYAMASAKYRKAIALDPGNLGLQDGLAIALVQEGKYEEAEHVLRSALMKFNNASRTSTTTDQYLYLCMNLSVALDCQGKHADATNLLRACMQTDMWKNHSLDDTTSVALADLANSLYHEGKHQEALLLFQKSLNIATKAEGYYSLQVATLMNNLGCLYQDMRAYPDAEKAYTQAVMIRASTEGIDNPEGANSLNNLGCLYMDTRNYEAAKPMLDQSLAIRLKFLGPSHRLTAQSISNLAAWYCRQQDYKRSLSLVKEALRIKEANRTTQDVDMLYLLDIYQGDLSSLGDQKGSKNIRKRREALMAEMTKSSITSGQLY